MERNIKAVITVALIAAALVAFMTLNPLVIVHPGQRGVVIQLGAVQSTILDEGIHFVMPLTQSVKKMDVQIQKVEVASEASSKDLQMVHATVALNSMDIATVRVDIPEVCAIFCATANPL